MYFVYRSHYDGPLSKQLVHLPDASVLDWFRRGWAEGDPGAWLVRELDGEPYGLSSIFEAAARHGLPAPTTWQELRAVLHEHLYVEGDSDNIRVDEHTLRVKTDDDEVELAYFFFDDAAVAAAPDRLAYLLHPQWPLPADAAGAGGFQPAVATRTLTGDAGPGATYAVLLTFYDGESIATTPPGEFAGVRLPELAAHLRARSADLIAADCPPELKVLASQVAAGEGSIRPALARCNTWPGFNLNGDPWPADSMPADPVPAESAVLPELAKDRDPDRSLLRVDEHIAQLAMYCNGPFGYQQWYLFDDVWAATHPDLAQSLLRYSSDWDPFD